MCFFFCLLLSVRSSSHFAFYFWIISCKNTLSRVWLVWKYRCLTASSCTRHQNCLQFSVNWIILHYPRGATTYKKSLSFPLKISLKQYAFATTHRDIGVKWEKLFPLFSNSERVKLAETRVSFTQAREEDEKIKEYKERVRQFLDVFQCMYIFLVWYGYYRCVHMYHRQHHQHIIRQMHRPVWRNDTPTPQLTMWTMKRKIHSQRTNGFMLCEQMKQKIHFCFHLNSKRQTMRSERRSSKQTRPCLLKPILCILFERANMHLYTILKDYYKKPTMNEQKKKLEKKN